MKKIIFIWFLILIIWLLSINNFLNKLEYAFKKIETDLNSYILSQNDYKTKIDQMILPSVKIKAFNETIGTGTIIARQENIYYVLTAGHISRERFGEPIITVDSISGENNVSIPQLDFEITLYLPGEKPRTIVSQFVDEKFDKIYDVGLLKFESDIEIKNIVKLANEQIINELIISQPVYAVGCSLGHDPLISDGLISAIITNENEICFMSTTQIAPGSSGGGLFVKYKDDYYLIGITNKVDIFMDNFFTHLTSSVPLKIFKDFLTKNKIPGIS